MCIQSFSVDSHHLHNTLEQRGQDNYALPSATQHQRHLPKPSTFAYNPLGNNLGHSRAAAEAAPAQRALEGKQLLVRDNRKQFAACTVTFQTGHRAVCTQMESLDQATLTAQARARKRFERPLPGE